MPFSPCSFFFLCLLFPLQAKVNFAANQIRALPQGWSRHTQTDRVKESAVAPLALLKFLSLSPSCGLFFVPKYHLYGGVLLCMWTYSSYCLAAHTEWCSEIGSLTSLDAPELHAFSDIRDPISYMHIHAYTQSSTHAHTHMHPWYTFHRNIAFFIFLFLVTRFWHMAACDRAEHVRQPTYSHSRYVIW